MSPTHKFGSLILLLLLFIYLFICLLKETKVFGVRVSSKDVTLKQNFFKIYPLDYKLK
jgi:hypothetical protein